MNFISKQNIIGLATGIAILAGTMSPLIAEAVPQPGPGASEQPLMIIGQQKLDRDKIAQKLSDMCGVDKKDVLGYINEGVQFKDLSMAAFVAKASEKSLTDVMNVKRNYSDWRDAIKALGVTEKKMKASHNDIVSTLFENNLDIPKQTSLPLLEKGYQPRDIAVANELSINTEKPINDVLAMKQISNNWRDIATSLGVSDDTFKQDMDNIHEVLFPHGEFFDDTDAPMI